MDKKTVSATTTAVPEDQAQLGEYVPAKVTDQRSPCPMLNALANHGYFPRDGRDMTAEHLKRGLKVAGLHPIVCWMGSKLVFADRKSLEPAPSFLGRIWQKLTNTFKGFSLHVPGQVDPKTGARSVHLPQIGDAGLVEHDISLTRIDRASGDCLVRQPDLIKDLIAASSDGGKTITVEDLSALRLRRIEAQKKINPKAEYGKFQHTLACGEIALLLNTLGDGKSARIDYVKALIEEERLPIKEGWKARSGWSAVGMFNLLGTSNAATKIMGLKF